MGTWGQATASSLGAHQPGSPFTNSAPVASYSTLLSFTPSCTAGDNQEAHFSELHLMGVFTSSHAQPRAWLGASLAC